MVVQEATEKATDFPAKTGDHYVPKYPSILRYLNEEETEDAAKKSVRFDNRDDDDDDGGFQPTHETCTPRLARHKNLKYRTPAARSSDVLLRETLAPSQSSVGRPNYDDSLRRVSVVLYQHIGRSEKRSRSPELFSRIEANHHAHRIFRHKSNTRESRSHVQNPSGSSHWASRCSSNTSSSRSSSHSSSFESDVEEEEPQATFLFDENEFVHPQYKYTFHRLPTLHPMTCYRMKQVFPRPRVPTVDEIYRFCRHLFYRAQLSPECSIVCLIYIERLMERADLLLLARNWKPIVMCGLLLASKVWQDLSSWNVEFAMVYPQFSLLSINRLERRFLTYIQWDLYISGSVYAKYYFALRSLTEQKNFRRRYNYTVKVDPPNAKFLEERSAVVKNELYSQSV